LGTKLNVSTSFHPQTDGQTERTIQTMEDILRACALDFKGSWDRYLPLIEFAYNNSHQASIKMVPYEALYGRRCRSTFCWYEVEERRISKVELIDEVADKVKIIRKRLRADKRAIHT